MHEALAKRRYQRGLVPAMVIFLCGSFGLAWLDANADPSNYVMIAISVVPVAAALFMFSLHWRLLNEVDEYLRQIQINALLIGATVALTIATGWGYLESYIDAPALPIFWLNPIFWIVYGSAAAVMTKRAGSFS